MISLNKVNASNVWKLLELQVLPEQEDFVATNTESIVEAYTTLAAGGTALPFGVYADGQPVGFVMFGYGPIPGDEDEPPVAAGNYCLWRFMIDRNFQAKPHWKRRCAIWLAFPAGLPSTSGCPMSRKISGRGPCTAPWVLWKTDRGAMTRS